jgi:hypothetical protein
MENTKYESQDSFNIQNTKVRTASISKIRKSGQLQYPKYDSQDSFNIQNTTVRAASISKIRKSGQLQYPKYDSQDSFNIYKIRQSGQLQYQVRVITVFTVFRLLTDFVCLYTYEF